jgi:glyoxalase superfamily protein
MILPIYEIAFDCLDPYRVADFWRNTLDYVQEMPTPEEMDAAYAKHPEWRDIAIVEDQLARHPRLYLQRVPEPKIGRNRITFEITLGVADFPSEVERLLSLGASRLDDREFADPEGNEFQVHHGDDGTRRFSAVVIEALDPKRLADFWGQIFGYETGPDSCYPRPGLMESDTGELVIGGRRLGLRVPGMGVLPDGPVHAFTPSLNFRSTSEAKTHKNRIHFDLLPTQTDEDRARAFALGATPEDLPGTGHRAMFDPEGNEFCLHDDSMFA